MKFSSAIMLVAVAFAITACGSNFEWFPDKTPPTISASIGGTAIFNNATTHLAALPAQVIFTAAEKATVYYTVNGSDPTTASSAVAVAAAGSSNGPSISTSGTILKFFGIDSAANSSAIQTNTIVSP